MNKPIVGTEILTFKEDDLWIAVWVRKDVIGYGATETIAVQKLMDNIALNCVWNTMDGKDPFDGIDEPDVNLLAEWYQKHKNCHEQINSLQN